MKTASSAPSQTTTVAPIQVPIPLMETPSEKTSVMTSATNVEMSATPPSADDVERLRRNVLSRNGVISATTTVKMISERMNPVTSISKSSNTSDATISPTALPTRTMAVRTRNRITAMSL